MPDDFTPTDHILPHLAPAARRAYRRAAASPATVTGQRERFWAAGGQCFGCRDTGLVADGVPCDACPAGHAAAGRLAEAAAAAAAQARARTVAALTTAAELAPYARRTLATWPGSTTAQGRKALARISKWRDTWPADGFALVLWSTVSGCGKTSLAAALLRERIAATAQPGALVSVPALLDALRPGPQQQPGRLAELAARDALVLDDLGIGGETLGAQPRPWVREKLFELIDARYRAGRWTVYTSDLDVDTALPAWLGDRLFYRIREGAQLVMPGTTNFRDP